MGDLGNILANMHMCVDIDDRSRSSQCSFAQINPEQMG